MDILDLNIENFKYFGIFLGLITFFYFGASLISPRNILTSLLDDPIFLTFRLVGTALAFNSLWFIVKWRQMIRDQELQIASMNSNIREQILYIESGKFLAQVEASRGGRAQELMDKLAMIKDAE